MTNFIKLVPAFALVVGLSPFLATAQLQHASLKSGQPALTEIASQLAANSKGRPAEFAHAANQVAANSKGRPGEFAPAATNQVAANSKGRPGEFLATHQA